MMLVLALFGLNSVKGQSITRFDLTDRAQARLWTPAHDVTQATSTPEGLKVVIGGGDPYLYGPVRDYPAGQPLWLNLRMRSETGGMGQLFYFSKTPAETDSVRFSVRAKRWEEVHVPLPSLGPGIHLRLDPPGSKGVCTVAWIEITPRVSLTIPAWPKPAPPMLDRDTLSLRSGKLTLTQAHHQWGGFSLRVAGHLMALGHTRAPILYLLDGQVHSFVPADEGVTIASREVNAIAVRCLARDPDGANWEMWQRFALGPDGAIRVSSTAQADRPRDLLFLPHLLLRPGAGSFGPAKQQALLGGLEYLDRDEPSRSEADVIGPGARRLVPAAEKVTLPLMALAQGGCYVGLMWEPALNAAPVFDSPDRTLHAGGHLMGLIGPGSDGTNRDEGSALPYGPLSLKAGQTLAVQGILLGGLGDSVTPAIQQAVALHGLPTLPKLPLDWRGYSHLVAAGWLQSSLRAGNEFRHAFPNFTPQPAADAALILRYLASQTADLKEAARWESAAQRALMPVAPAEFEVSGVGHVHTPAAPLVFGTTPTNALQAAQNVRADLARFDADGTIHYHRPPDGADLGHTHFAPHASGLTAQVVAETLEQAVASGHSALIVQALTRLHTLDRYRNGVPRGAQTWEVPLHTPDILASAYLVRAYTLGYELTGEPQSLAQARYWAWTGVPFVYLVDPEPSDPVGEYSTIAVYGATQWSAPLWIGLPVQWCGLVYADALYHLAPLDPEGPWKRLADGITICGIQQTWPLGSDPDRQGLLPDSYDLRSQTRNDPAINPATLFTEAIHLYGRPPLYDRHICLDSGLTLLAPGAISKVRDDGQGVTFTVDPWPREPCTVRITGLKNRPKVRINGQEASLSTPNSYSEPTGILNVRVRGKASVSVRD